MFGKANRRHSKILWGIWVTAFSFIWTVTQLAAAWNNFPFWVLKLQTVQYNVQHRGSFNPGPILAEERLSKYVWKRPSIKHRFGKGLQCLFNICFCKRNDISSPGSTPRTRMVRSSRKVIAELECDKPSESLFPNDSWRNTSAFTLTSFCLNHVQMWEFNHLCSALELCSVQC